jgi:hypothetical protein
MNEHRKKTIKKSCYLIAVAIAILLVFSMGRVRSDDSIQETEEDFFDPEAVTGILPDMSEEEIQKELDRVVEEGMLNISISSGISFQSGTSKGKANIYNVSSNQYIFKVEITLKETGETVYASKGIKPGQYIQYIELEKDLEAGVYDATAMFTAYTEDTHQVVGNAGAEVTLYVEE